MLTDKFLHLISKGGVYCDALCNLQQSARISGV